MADPFYSEKGCIACRYLKYYYDPSTTICCSCRKQTGNIWSRDNWEPRIESPLDLLSKELNKKINEKGE